MYSLSRPAPVNPSHETTDYFRRVSFEHKRKGPRRVTTILVGFVCILVLMAGMGIQSISSLRRAHAAEAESVRVLSTMLLVAMALGVVVAVMVVGNNARLEARNRQQYQETLATKQDLERLSARLVTLQEEERQKISRELHDQVGQSLTAIKIDISRVEQKGNLSDPDLAERLRRARTGIDQTLQVIRGISMLLRPSMLSDIGLSAAVNWYARQFSENTGIQVDLSDDASAGGLPEAHKTSLYRIIQEALTNCARHAVARSVTISLASTATQYTVCVKDDGQGLAPSAQSGQTPRGLGFIGIEERVRAMHGVLEIQSAPGQGVAVRVCVPLGKKAAAA